MRLLLTVQNYEYKMKSQCLKCGKYIENINQRVLNTSNSKTTIVSKCAISGSKNHETKRLLSNLGLTTPLSKAPLIGDILF